MENKIIFFINSKGPLNKWPKVTVEAKTTQKKLYKNEGCPI